MVMASGLPRPQVFSLVEHVLKHGKPGGRRAAAEALADFSGAEANSVAVAALSDPEPTVQAAIVAQLRRRGIPGILSRLVEILESPHAVVRQAARKSLSEFSFKRFVGAFDMLDDEVRRNTGMLVRKTDPQTIPQLMAELRSKMRTRRLRGLAIARTLEVVEAAEAAILPLMQDEDHMVRMEAAIALGTSNSDSSRLALEEALGDRSPVVQEAAQKSLDSRATYAAWRGELADPRD
jgi:HEAT repeat protein